MSELAQWNSFYVIVGSSAGALIGLQFVVLALIADLPIARGAAQAGDAFSTSSVVHFGVVLLLSAVATAPWPRRTSLGISGLHWSSLHRHRGSASESANRLPARIRGLVISCSASICGIRNAGWIGIRGSLACALRPVPRCRCGATAALHWHSQCLGHRHVLRLVKKRDSDEAE
jgi:hypothetical protein